MFFFLSKILAFLTAPFIYVVILILWAWRTKKEGRRKKLLSYSVILIMFFGNDFIADEFIRMWETEDQYSPTEQYDVGIVLSGMINYDATNDIEKFNSNTDRLLRALPLLKKGQFDKMLFTGGSGDIYHPENSEGMILQRYFKKIAYPDSNIIYEHKSRNTYQNARYSKEVLDSLYPNQKSKTLVITSAMHMRRTIGCFENQGISPDYICTNRRVGARKFEFEHCFIPGIRGFSKWTQLGHEMIGYFTYKLTGKI